MKIVWTVLALIMLMIILTPQYLEKVNRDVTESPDAGVPHSYQLPVDRSSESLRAKEQPRETKSGDDLTFVRDLKIVTKPGFAMVITPFGPCGTVTQMSPHQWGVSMLGFSATGVATDDDNHIYLYPTAELALKFAGRSCDAWYLQEKTNREAAAEIGHAWDQEHKASQY